MKSGIYFRGKFIKIDPLQLDVGEKVYVLFEPWELIEKSQPDCFIAKKTEEIRHESGAIIHKHIWIPAPPKLKEIIKSAEQDEEAPKTIKGLKRIIKNIR